MTASTHCPEVGRGDSAVLSDHINRPQEISVLSITSQVINSDLGVPHQPAFTLY